MSAPHKDKTPQSDQLCGAVLRTVSGGDVIASLPLPKTRVACLLPFCTRGVRLSLNGAILPHF